MATIWVVNTIPIWLRRKRQRRREKGSCCLFSNRISSIAIGTISPEHSAMAVDYRSSAICRNNRHVSADVRAPKFIACVHACGGDQDHAPFSGDRAEDHGAWTGFARESIPGERARARTNSNDGREGEEDERQRANKWERREKKRKRKATGREVVRIQSSKLAGERVIAFRDYDVEFVALCPLSSLLSCNASEDEKEKDTTERKITGSHEIFREGVVEKQGNYGRRKDPRAQFNVINRGKMKHRVNFHYIHWTWNIWSMEDRYYRVEKFVARIYNGMENVSVHARAELSSAFKISITSHFPVNCCSWNTLRRNRRGK